jgi:excisionase family DNA binding protein
MMTETPGTQTISSRMSIPEIARRLNIGRQSVYAMLEQGLLPGIRLGRRWLVTRYAFESWERTCGMRGSAKTADETKLTPRDPGHLKPE